MKLAKIILSAMFFTLIIAVSAQAAGQAIQCPVMPGHDIKEKFSVFYRGKRVGLCCRSCVKSFRKHPERYLKNLPEDYFS